MEITLELDTNKIVNKVTNDKVGLFISNEWKRQIDPFTPRDTGMMMETVDIKPFKIHYKTPYSQRNYYGSSLNFQKVNPYAIDHWDEAAQKAGKLNNVYRAVNSALESGKI